MKTIKIRKIPNGPLFLTLAGLLAFALAIFSQVSGDTLKAQEQRAAGANFRFVLPEELVAVFSLGFNNLLADWYWITAIQELHFWDGKSSYYADYYRNITTLDPRFVTPYIIGALTIPSRTNPDTYAWVEMITRRGIAEHPDNWKIPFTAGVALHIADRNTKRAAEFLAIAAGAPSATELVKRTYAIYLMHDRSEYQQSRLMFEAIADTADQPEARRIAKERILLIDFIEAAELGLVAHKQRFGVYPRNLDALFAPMGGIPEELKKYRLTFDQASGAVLFGR